MVTNTSGETVSFTAAIQPTAMYSIFPTSGTLQPSGNSGSAMPLMVTFNPAGALVAPGYYTGTYTVSPYAPGYTGLHRPARSRQLASVPTNADRAQPRVSNGDNNLGGGTAQNDITATLQLTPPQLTFTFLGQELSFAVQDMSGAKNVQFTVNYGDQMLGAGAVTVSSDTYTTPQTMLEARATSLGPAPGPNNGGITINCANVDCGEISPTILVDLEVPVPVGPTVNNGGVVNAANYSTQGVAPGSIVGIFGTDLTSQVVTANAIPLSTSLDIVKSVTFNGFPAGLYFVSPQQINAQVPWESLAASGATATVGVVVTTSTGASVPQTVSVLPAVPGIFTANQRGTGQAIATDNTTNFIAAPAGSIRDQTTAPISIGSGHALIVWCTGLGDVTPSIADNVNSINPDGSPTFRNTVLKPAVTVGGVQAQFIYSILAPQYVSEYQVAVLLDPSTPTGDTVPLVVTINGVPTNNNVTIAVAP
jgi:uncharacterized protein (TIGR03437 family)